MKSRQIATRTLYLLHRLSRRMWLRTTAFALLAVLAAGLSRPLAAILPDGLVSLGDARTVLDILSVLSSSMLAVTTFSLGVIVSARQAISSTITPRAHDLVAGDPVTQRVLAVFMGAFVYALTAQILVRTRFYDDRASAVVLLVSVMVIALVVAAMLRWIDHLTRMGSVSDTVEGLEDLIEPAFDVWRRQPALGAAPCSPGLVPDRAASAIVRADRAGYVRHIDLPKLDALARAAGDGASVVIDAAIGRYVLPGAPLCRFVGGTTDIEDLSACFTLGVTRTFDQDARFGVIVLAEIAQRALSPAVNDPGTAIFVLDRITRLIAGRNAETPPEAPDFPHVLMAPVTADDLVRDGFSAIARDAAGMVEVQARLLKSLDSLAAHREGDLARAAAAAARRAAALSEAALVLESDREKVRSLAARVARDG